MNRRGRLVVLGFAGALGIGLPVAISPYIFGKDSIFHLVDPGAVGTVLAAFIALFGLVFTAIFSEISAYYKDRGLGMQKKWELIFPLLRDHYNPWIQDAGYLSHYLTEIKDCKSFSEEQATRIMYYVSLLFSTRLRFSVKAGGRPILAQDSDEQSVLDAYRAMENTLDWTDHQKRRTEIAYLTQSFMSKDTPEKPYTSFQFAKDVRVNRKMQAIREEIMTWLSKERAEKVAAALDEFQERFRTGINRLYSGWVS